MRNLRFVQCGLGLASVPTEMTKKIRIELPPGSVLCGRKP